LNRVAAAWHEHEDDRIRVVDDVYLRLSNPDGLEQDVLATRGVHEQRRLE